MNNENLEEKVKLVSEIFSMPLAQFSGVIRNEPDMLSQIASKEIAELEKLVARIQGMQEPEKTYEQLRIRNQIFGDVTPNNENIDTKMEELAIN